MVYRANLGLSGVEPRRNLASGQAKSLKPTIRLSLQQSEHPMIEPGTSNITSFVPRVRGATNTRSPNVESLLGEMDDGSYYVPDYQRDSSQWDLAKRSLFIDSLINNLTVPPLIVYPETDATGGERHQIIDGQQRLTTIRDYLKGVFALAPESEVEYAENVGPLVQGKKFDELPDAIKRQIKRYVLNIIVLPKDLDLSLRLEIFRRINEAGVPLSPHDLRLAVFGQSDRVYFIRLAGVFDPDRDGASRMINAAKSKFALQYPWKDPEAWKAWWSDTAHSSGQAPSQMFLYYILARDIANVATLLDSAKAQDATGVRYDKTTISVLDLYLAQLQREDTTDGAPRILADINTLKEWFDDFERWFNVIRAAKVPRVSTNSSTKLALFIAAAAEVWEQPDDISESQWELIQILLTQGPSKIETAVGLPYPIPKGKWPGQRAQIERTGEVCQAISKR